MRTDFDETPIFGDELKENLEMTFKIVIFGKCFIENRMGKIRVGWLIHIFAVLHAAVALACRAGGVEDELLLTILTMTMALLICVKNRFNAEFTAATIIVVNIIGYLLGNAGATILSYMMGSNLAIHALATALTTEILGWSIVAFSNIMHKGRSESGLRTASFLHWIILAMGAIFAIRIGIIFLASSEIFASGAMMNAVSKVLSSSFALIILICINTIYVRYSRRLTEKLSSAGMVAVLVCFMAISALIGAGLCSIGLSFEPKVESWMEFFRIYIVALIAQITIYCIVFMVNYAISADNRMQIEKEKKHAAQFRYQKLKRQVNPHFLFNSLNALDCLVWEEKTEQASTYIHKLASVYRYMIRSEEEDFVTLGDELTFVNMYIDLLKVRFPEGFDVIIDVPEDVRARFVLPCSIQLLIENATKHNAVNKADPLIITLKTEKDHIKVFNPIIPKVSNSPSTGLGLKYMKQQYLDLSGKNIDIEHTDKTFCVTIPLL